jgi:AraC-like DNA-binding protein
MNIPIIKISHACDSESYLSGLEIAYTVGFNSKSTFNEAIKRHTGITPKEFRKKAPIMTSF